METIPEDAEREYELGTWKTGEFIGVIGFKVVAEKEISGLNPLGCPLAPKNV